MPTQPPAPYRVRALDLPRHSIAAPEQAFARLAPFLRRAPAGAYAVVVLGQASRVQQAWVLLPRGRPGPTAVVREILRRIRGCSAGLALLVARRTAGPLRPTGGDRLRALRLQAGASGLRLALLDYLVLHAGAFVSLAAQGIVRPPDVP
jgi:DNA repair protein RadC